MRFIGRFSLGLCSAAVLITRGISDLEIMIYRNRWGYMEVSGLSGDDDQEARNLMISLERVPDSEYVPPDEMSLVLLPSIDSSVEPLSLSFPSRRPRCLNIGFGSQFSQDVGSVMILPVNPVVRGTRFRMITSPIDALSFCFEGTLVRTQMWEGLSGGPTFSAIVGLRSFDTNEFVPLSVADSDDPRSTDPYMRRSSFKLSTEGEKLSLPSAINRTIIEAIRREGFTINRNHRIPRLDPGCSNLIPRLPTIQFFVGSPADAENEGGNFFFEPTDYIRVDETTGECYIMLYLDESSSHPEFNMGLPFFEQMGVLLDYQNSQIGICDPL